MNPPAESTPDEAAPDEVGQSLGSSQTRPAELERYPVVIELPVLWGDQDAFGHVNNTIPIRWFESARIAYLEQCGLEHLMNQEGLGPILASITCHYRRQIHYPATVWVGARVGRVGRSSMAMYHLVYNASQREVAAEGESVIVVFNYETQRPTRISEELRQTIAAFEPSPPEMKSG